MVGVLTAIVAVLVPVTGLNLVLLFAVIRRLRAAEAGHASPGAPAGAGLPAPGALIGEFLVPAVDDSVISDQDVADAMYVACVMPGCQPCEQQIAALRADTRFPAERVVLFVFDKGDPAATEELAASLTGLGRVALTRMDSEVSAAFGAVDSFPTLLRTGGGRIAGAARTWAELAEPVGARAL